MRKEYGKALRDMFAALMKAKLPEWKPAQLPKSHYFGGERGFVLDRSPAAWLVIVLQPNLKDHDAFDVQIGWSAHGRMPEISMRPCMEEPHSADAAAREEYLCSLGALAPGNKLPNGWVIDPRTFSVDVGQVLAAMTERQARITDAQARETLTPFVDEAFGVLTQQGLPYLERQLSRFTPSGTGRP